MTKQHVLCVDCFDRLQQICCDTLVLHYCNNPKCRRFGVLTVGGLEDSRCQKIICDPHPTWAEAPPEE